jgi:U4/U6 small nuclear ribonucleoprotein PRP4
MRHTRELSGAVSEPEVLAFSEKTLKRQTEARTVVENFEKKKRAKKLNIPTNDNLVKARLRELAEPIILFAERPEERRERLRELLGNLGIDEAMPQSSSLGKVLESAPDVAPNELFYTEGSVQLKQARLAVLEFSLMRARERVRSEQARYRQQEALIRESHALLEKMQQEHEHDAQSDALRQVSHRYASEQDDRARESLFRSLSTLHTELSQIGDERPLVACCFSPDGARVATASWSGICKVWDASNTALQLTLDARHERATHVAFSPLCGNVSPGAANIATCGADRSVCLWSLLPCDEAQRAMQVDDDEHDSANATLAVPLARLQGHTDRVNAVAWHPCGRYVASASHDTTWALWDVESATRLLEQEGHALGVNTLAFQPDGGIVASAGVDAIVRVWDVRSGKTVVALKGHAREIHALDWAPNGFQLATGGADNQIRMWDLRKKKTVGVITGHTNLISSVCYQKGAGDILLSSSYDGCVKLWSCKEIGRSLNTLRSTEPKITHADIASDSQRIVTCSFDRTWKLWSVNPSK